MHLRSVAFSSRLALVCFAMFVIGVGVALGGSAGRGREVFATCAGCHGAQGEGLEEKQAPRLAGLEEWYVRRQLQNFQERRRGADEPAGSGFLTNAPYSKLMHPVASGFDRRQREEVIAYLSTLKPVSPLVAVPGEVDRGRLLYEGSCRGCHGPRAEGSWVKRAPRLTGQHGWYLAAQLKDFRMGWRGTHLQDRSGRQMRPAADLSDTEIRDLVAFLISLNRPK